MVKKLNRNKICVGLYIYISMVYFDLIVLLLTLTLNLMFDLVFKMSYNLYDVFYVFLYLYFIFILDHLIHFIDYSKLICKNSTFLVK